jgi:hypothetical protein
MISPEARQNAIIVEDGVYEQYLSTGYKDDHSDRCHSCYAGCRGNCGVGGERCMLYEGKNRYGHLVMWCMCGDPESVRALYENGLKVAEEHLPSEKFANYKVKLEAFLLDAQ